MRILVTAIGSMSAECVIASLRAAGHEVVGTDCHPAAYNPIAASCSAFLRMPRAPDDPDGFCASLCACAVAQRVVAVVPLTDPEIDVLSPRRARFEENGISLWIANDLAVRKARDKRLWSAALAGSRNFRTIPTYGSLAELKSNRPGEFVAKRANGRSSEGIVFAHTETCGPLAACREGYIFQPRVAGDVVTVDFARHPKSHAVVAVARKELLRTKNGAGTVVEILSDDRYRQAVDELASDLDLTGAMNAEFIEDEGGVLHLMDINPRFSAGVSFSMMAGYDFAGADVDCFCADDIQPSPEIPGGSVFVKRFCDFRSNSPGQGECACGNQVPRKGGSNA